MARAATQLSVREICSGAQMSPRTIGLIEGAAEIEYGVKQEGRFEEQTVAKLVRFYREQGVTFAEPEPRRGPSVYYKPKTRT